MKRLRNSLINSKCFKYSILNDKCYEILKDSALETSFFIFNKTNQIAKEQNEAQKEIFKKIILIQYKQITILKQY